MNLLKWWLLFCGSLTATYLAWQFGLLDALYRADKSFIGFACIGLYFSAMVYIGLSIKQRVTRGIPMLWLVTNGLVELGLLGTLIGFLMMLGGVSLETLNISNVAETQKALTAMSTGMYTAMSTTLVGLVTHLLLKVQMTAFDR